MQNTNVSDTSADVTTPPLSFDDISCVVCMTVVLNPQLFPCDHFVCLTCWDRIRTSNASWRANCPMCRNPVTSVCLHTDLYLALVTGPCGQILRVRDLVDPHAFDCATCARQVFTNASVDELAKSDNLIRVQWLYSLGFHITHIGWRNAIIFNAHRVVQWLMYSDLTKGDTNVTESDITAAICNNAINVLKLFYAYERNDNNDNDNNSNRNNQSHIEMAIASGHIEIVRFLWENAPENPPIYVPTTTLIHLVEQNNTTLVKLLWTLGVQPDCLMDIVLTHGQNELFAFLMSYGAQPSDMFMRTFMRDANIDTIQMMHAHHYEFSINHVIYAMHTPDSHETILFLMNNHAWSSSMESFTKLAVALRRDDVIIALWDSLIINQELIDHAASTAAVSIIKCLGDRNMLPSQACFHDILSKGSAMVTDMLLDMGMRPEGDIINTILPNINPRNTMFVKVLLMHDLITPETLEKLHSCLRRFLHYYQCASCPAVTMNTCSTCNYVRYCNEECERADHLRHKVFCTTLCGAELHQEDGFSVFNLI